MGHLQDAWRAIAEKLAEQWADFRARSRYYQAKAYVLATYGGIVILTVLWAPPAEHNHIGAAIILAHDDLFGRYLLVENKGDEAWTKVRYTLNEHFRLKGQKYRRLDRGGRVSLFISKFRRRIYSKKKRRHILLRPRAGMALERLDITTDQGGATFDLRNLGTLSSH